MERHDPHIATSSASKLAANRAFPRYPVRFEAVLCYANGQTLDCEVRNYCAAGMYIVFGEHLATLNRPLSNPPVLGDQITIQCRLSEAAASQDVSFKARILRADHRSIGVAFIDPPLAALQRMQDYVLKSHTASLVSIGNAESQDEEGNKRGSYSSQHINKITQSCNQAALEMLDTLLERTFKLSVNRLFEKSSEAEHFTVQSQYYNGSNTVKNLTETLLQSIKQVVLNKLSNVELLISGDNEPKTPETSVLELSLIEDNELEDFIANADTVNTVETLHSQVLSSLTSGLSILFNDKIDVNNNPYGAKLFVDAFQNVIKSFELDSFTLKVCYSAFKDTLIELTGDLYKTMNTILSEHGIRLEKLQYKKDICGPSSSEPTNSLQVSPTAIPLTEQTSIKAHSQEGGGVSSKETSDVTRGADDIPIEKDANFLDSEIVDEQQASTHQANSSVDSDADLYKVVRELLDLRQVLKKEKGEFSDGSQALEKSQEISTGTTTVVEYETKDIVSAISSLQQKFISQDTHVIDSGHIKEHIKLTLGQGESERCISQQHCEVLDVSDGLFDALLHDPLVAESVKPWIIRLRLPILKLALQDYSIFVDRSHVVRCVIDKISQLEFYHEDKSTIRQNGLASIVDKLVDQANEHFDGTDQVFHKMLKRLDRICRMQHEAYAANLQEVQAHCAIEVPTPTNEYTEAQRNWLDDSEWKIWLKHARRLNVGDRVNFRADGLTDKKLRIAWISNDLDIFVLVNYLGLKSKVFAIKDLALHLFHGRITSLDNADDPAMDRAQLSMLQNLHEQLLHETTHDQLTGLLNRREFERLLDAALDTAKFDGLKHVLCFIDVDHFSVVNDLCGYSGGDKLLTEFATLIRGSLDDKSSIARLGSDELGILFNQRTIDDGLDLAGEILETVSDFRFEWGSHRLSVGISIGLVPINVNSHSTPDILKSAQSASVIAKEAGGNRLQLYHSDHAHLSHRNEMTRWLGIIDKTLDDNRISLRCQRINPTNSNSTCLSHYEILLGVLDEQNQVMLPKEFIQAAEAYHRMPVVDRWVIKNTFKQMAAHRKSLENISGITINLSGQSLTDEDLVSFIEEEIRSSQVPTDKVCFEITESVGISNLSDAVDFIQQVKLTGCKFALDDFGSGMSSYSYLKHLPVDYLKIDGSFIERIEENANDYAVVKSICEIAHFMDKKVIAEYVQTDAALTLLQQIGVDYVQGYFIEEPQSLEKLLTHISH